MKHKPPITIIYCLKNPVDRNRVFYIGKTILKLNVRLSQHISNPSNRKMAMIIAAITAAGKRPTIHELDTCTGYHDVYVKERKWIAHYNRRKTKLANSMLTSRRKKSKHVYW